MNMYRYVFKLNAVGRISPFVILNLMLAHAFYQFLSSVS